MQRYIKLIGVLSCDSIKHLIESDMYHIEAENEGLHYHVSVYFSLLDYVVLFNQRYEYRVSANEYYSVYSEVKIENTSNIFTDDEIIVIGKAIAKTFGNERIDLMLLPKCRTALKTRFKQEK